LNKEKTDLFLLRNRSKSNPEKFEFTKKDEKRLEELKIKIRSVESRLGCLFELVMEKIKRRFKKIGYKVDFRVLNAVDFGVPQKRERVIFIGRKENGPITFPAPTHLRKNQSSLNRWTGMGDLKHWKTVREAISDLEDTEEDPSINHIFSSHSEEFKDRIKSTPIGKGMSGGRKYSFFRCPPDEPSITVMGSHGSAFVHYSKNRVMTPRELARLQSFPDDFIFKGSKNAILKQIGNAVPPVMAEKIAVELKKMLDVAYAKTSSNQPPAQQENNGDFQMPKKVLYPLAPYLNRQWIIWECARSKGGLSNYLKSSGFEVTATNILTEQNFLKRQPDKWDCAIANPPHSMELEFLERCYDLKKPFALLLPLATFEMPECQKLFGRYGVQVIFFGKRINLESASGKGSCSRPATAWFTNGLNLPRDLNFANIGDIYRF